MYLISKQVSKQLTYSCRTPAADMMHAPTASSALITHNCVYYIRTFPEGDRCIYLHEMELQEFKSVELVGGCASCLFFWLYFGTHAHASAIRRQRCAWPTRRWRARPAPRTSPRRDGQADADCTHTPRRRAMTGHAAAAGELVLVVGPRIERIDTVRSRASHCSSAAV